MNIPDEYYIECSKTYTEQKKTKYYLAFHVVIAVLATHLVLGAIFESFILPFIVMTSIPFLWICALRAVYIHGASCNMVAVMGLIVLTGTVVNNSILHIVSYTNELSKKKTTISPHDYTRFSLQRFRPMIMITLTTASGLFFSFVCWWQKYSLAGFCNNDNCRLIRHSYNNYEYNADDV